MARGGYALWIPPLSVSPAFFEKSSRLQDREGAAVTKTIWQCEQLRAGRVWNKLLFQTQKEAEAFVRQMRSHEPDMFWRMEAVPAQAIWN
jgi:hypothetical protein